MKDWAYGAYCAASFLVLGLTLLLLNLFIADLRLRRQLAGAFARAFLRSAGIRLEVLGAQRLPREPCVLVANHASYIDGIVAVAALPPNFAFVIKKEMSRVPLAGLLLRRLGSEFVERFDRHQGAADTRRVLRHAAGGQSMVFFPEGTFDEHPVIGKFHGGAFAIALRSHMPVVAVAIHGTRAVLPAAPLRIRRARVRVQILEVLAAHGARERSRELIAHALGEPMAP